MVLTKEEVKELKKQLIEQVKGLPEDKRKDAEKQIEEMSSEAIEAMVEQQKGRQQVFRMIANKEIDSVIVAESNEAIAVLEINPLSRGHTMVIPKEEVSKKENMPKGVVSFAEGIVKKIERSLKSKKVNMVIGEKMGEAVIDLIPVYDKENSGNRGTFSPESPMDISERSDIINRNIHKEIDGKTERKRASKEELEQVSKEINTEVIKKAEPEKIKIEKKEEKAERVKLKRRIP